MRLKKKLLICYLEISFVGVQMEEKEPILWLLLCLICSPSPPESELSLYDEETRLSGEDENGMLSAATAGTSPGSGGSQETGYHSAEEATETKDKDESSKSFPKKSKRGLFHSSCG